MKLRCHPYTLSLKNTFTISHSSRKTTPAVIVELEHDGIIGYGEASLPPYLGETIDTVCGFLSHVKDYDINDLSLDILDEIDAISTGNTAAKAAFDIALHDWIGKKMGYPVYKMLGIEVKNIPYTSFTIGIDTAESIKRKVAEACEYKILKVKIGNENDKTIINTIRDMTDVPIRVDANQGWKDKYHALDMIEWLAEQNVELVEQPLPVNQLNDILFVKERSRLPIIADESVQRLVDIKEIKDAFDGINIKLMKCTGIREAHRMILLAKSIGLKVMLGCMTETSCAISAASHLSPLADWVDLDGSLLITNDCFDGAELLNGKIIPLPINGIGAKVKENFSF